MSSGNRTTFSINWRWCRHVIKYTKEIRHEIFVLRDIVGIGSAPQIRTAVSQ